MSIHEIWSMDRLYIGDELIN